MNTMNHDISSDGKNNHTGKIGRLPRQWRDQLNARLDNGEDTESLLAWLNGLAEVKQVLARSFGGNPVNAQNLSNWRQGGFQQWLKWRERERFMQDWMMDADELTEDNRDLAGRLTTVLLAELAMAVQEVLPKLTEPGERCEKIMEYLRVLSRVRQQEQAEQRLEWEAADREREHTERLEGQLKGLEMRLAMGKVLQEDQAGVKQDPKAATGKDRTGAGGSVAAGDGKGKSRRADEDIGDTAGLATGGTTGGGGRSQPIKANQASVTLDPDAAGQTPHMRMPEEGEVGRNGDGGPTESITADGASSQIKLDNV